MSVVSSTRLGSTEFVERNLLVGRTDHFVGVGAVASEGVGIVHLWLDLEGVVGGHGFGLDEHG